MDLTEKLKLLLGLRYDDFDSSRFNRLTDVVLLDDGDDINLRVGLVYEPNELVTIYGSFAEGFRPTVGANFAGEPFEPEKTESAEVGARFTDRDSNWSSSVALFTATKSNILTADPINCCFSAQVGEADSRGVEVDVTGNLTDSISLYLSYAYVDAETANEHINLDWGVNVPAGARLINVPEHAATLSMQKGFSIGEGNGAAGFVVRYNGDMLGETIDQSYILPSYTLLNLFATYAPNDRFEFAVNVDNVTDEHYIANSYHKYWSMPGVPLSYSVSLQYSF
jgi:iron complex outermembrane receptor protein